MYLPLLRGGRGCVSIIIIKIIYKMPHKLLILGLLFLRLIFVPLFAQSPSMYKAMMTGRYEAALTEAARRLAADSSDAAVWYLKGHAHLALVQYREAYTAFLHAGRICPDSIPYLLALGQTAALLGRDGDAIRWYDGVLRHEPQNIVARTGLARACYNRHLFDKAVENYKILVQKDPYNYAYQKELGQAYYATDSLKKAVRHFHSAVNLNREDLNLANKTARIYLKLKEYTLASYIAAIGLKTDPAYFPLLETRGFALYRNKSYDPAAKVFEKCLLLGDSSLFVLKHLGYIYLARDSLSAAKEMLLAAWKKNNTLPEVAYYLGLAYENLEKYDTAARYLEKALVLYHPPAQLMAAIYRELANDYYLAEKWVRAFDNYGEALKLDPDNPEVLFRMGEICDYHTNEKKKAIYYYQRVVNMSKINPATWDMEKNTAVPLSVSAYYRIKALHEEMHFAGEKQDSGR